MTIGHIEKKILEIIKPTPEDYKEAETIYKTTKNKIISILKKERIEAKIELEGSIAKDTWLRTDPEMDIFIIFPRNTSKHVLEKMVKTLYEKMREYHPIISYAEHPYLTIQSGKFRIDLVPSIEKKEEKRIKTAVDRTPLHTKFVLEHTTPQLRDEIRLVKKFARKIGVYGAEIKVQGFSGYLLELLTIYYGGFRELLENASKWKPPIRINLGRETRLEERQDAPMYIPDPTDPSRNVASALSLQKLAEFSIASRLYLLGPSEYYFIDMNETSREDPRVKLLEPYYPYIIIIEFNLNQRIHPDTLWGEIKRARKNISKLLDASGFKVIRCSEWTDEERTAFIACIIEQPLLTQITLQKGPPYHNIEHSTRFIEKYILKPFQGPWIDNEGRLNAIIQRTHQHPVDLLKKHANDYRVSDLKNAKTKIYMLSWKPEVLQRGKQSEWLKDFVLGKPKWLLPYYYTLYSEKVD